MHTEVGFDIDENGALCSGILNYTDGKLSVSVNGKNMKELTVNNDSELILRTYSGCGTLELASKEGLKDCSDSILICRFSMSCSEEIGEFSKVINHFTESGEETQIKKDSLRFCPKCGRHYAKGMDVCLFCVDKSYIAKRTFKMLKPHFPKIIIAGVLLTLSSAFTAMLPVFSSRLVDNYLYDTQMDLTDKISGIVFTVFLICIFQVLGQIARLFSQRISNKAGADFSSELRLNTYDKIQRFSLTSMSKKTSGDLMRRVTRDTEIVKDFITSEGLYAFEKISMFIVVFIIMMRISPFLTLLVFIPVPIVLFLIRRFWQFIHIRYEKQWRCESKSNSILHDIVKGIRVVKTFGSEDREIKKFDNVSKKLCDISVSNEHIWSMTFPWLSFIMGVGEFFVLYFGGRLALNSTISAGMLLEFTLFLTYIYQPLRWLSWLPRRLGQYVTSMIKILEVVDEKENEESDTEINDFSLNGDIEFKDLTFGYKAYEPVLKNINLKVNAGEMIGLVGHSGAGKSTLINLIMRLYEPDSGSLIINGINVKNTPQELYREKIGAVFQETFLFNGTVYDNISYARQDAQPGEVIAAAKAANAHDFIMNLPDGYNTIVGEDGHNLSGGERQRISIARAVLRNPEILILDEATSALDPETEIAIQDALSRLIKGRTTFAIAHRLSTLKNADRLVIIEKGRIAEIGSHAELIQKDGIYAKLVKAQRQTAKLKK